MPLNKARARARARAKAKAKDKDKAKDKLIKIKIKYHEAHLSAAMCKKLFQKISVPNSRQGY